jgi:HrpA-like RNA helicase
VHEDSWERDFLLWLIKEFGEFYPTRFLFMSATAMTGTLVEFFGEDTTFIDVLTEPKYTVEECPPLLHDDASYSQCESSAVALTQAIVSANNQAHILLFVPGVQDCIRVAGLLRDGGITARVFHGHLEPLEQMSCISDTATKVKVATNLAESSLTFDRMFTDIVDTSYHREAVAVHFVDTQNIVPVDIHSSRQRKGRAGRIGNGTYHPMRLARPSKLYVPDLTRIVLHMAEFGRNRGVDYLHRLHDDELNLFGFPSNINCLLHCQRLWNTR